MRVHGAGGAPRLAQVLLAGRGMAARPFLPALPASTPIPIYIHILPAGSIAFLPVVYIYIYIYIYYPGTTGLY